MASGRIALQFATQSIKVRMTQSGGHGRWDGARRGHGLLNAKDDRTEQVRETGAWRQGWRNGQHVNILRSFSYTRPRVG